MTGMLGFGLKFGGGGRRDRRRRTGQAPHQEKLWGSESGDREVRSAVDRLEKTIVLSRILFLSKTKTERRTPETYTGYNVGIISNKLDGNRPMKTTTHDRKVEESDERQLGRIGKRRLNAGRNQKPE